MAATQHNGPMTTQAPHPHIVAVRPCGDAALAVEFGETIDPAINARVLALDAALAQAPIEGIVETVPTYRSLFVLYDPVKILFADLSAHLVALAQRPVSVAAPRRVWHVPVVYGGDHGIDLADFSARLGLAETEVVARHCAADYRIYMLGFSPGFSYLGGLDESLAAPRRLDPRLSTPSGTISIGGVQTAIQCLAGPSGWHLIGRTPVRTFHPARQPMFLMEPGDGVRFFRVPAGEWAALDRAAEAGDPVATCADAAAPAA